MSQANNQIIHDQLADEACEKIKGILSRHLQNAYLEAGQYLIDTFFEGDREKARNLDTSSKQSFNQLSLRLTDRGQGTANKTFLYDAIKMTNAEHDMKGFQTFGKLPTSKKLLLLPYSEEEKRELATEFVDKPVRECKQILKDKKQRNEKIKITQPAGKPVSGTKEWATYNINCCTGCPHGCRYCYARYDATERYKRVARDAWTSMVIRSKDVLRRYKKLDGMVMFPTTHDIVPENLYACIIVLENLLSVGNKVLIVSKPWMECIEPICMYLKSYKKQILFRFTIGATDDNILGFWEPNAPSYAERKRCLEHAYSRGFRTSVSSEPMLDSENIDNLISELMPFITDSMWIGKMNKIESRVKVEDEETKQAVGRINAGQTDDKIKGIYTRHKDNDKVKWKESIKDVVGIDIPTVSGLDI